MSILKYLEANDGSCRFYRVEVLGVKTIVTFGKIGNEGQTHEQTHASPAEASDYAENLVLKQQYKGFEKIAKRKLEVDEAGPRKSARKALDRSAKEEATAKITSIVKNIPLPIPTPKKTKKSTAKKVTKTTATKKTTKKPTAKRVANKKKTTTKKKTPTKKKASKKGKKATPKKTNEAPVEVVPVPAAEAIPVAGGTTASASTSATSSSSSSTKTNTSVPVEWEVTLPQNGYGIYVNDTHVYAGDETGLVQQFDKSGVVQKQYRLPTGVKCIVGDGIFLYAGTNDGSLYDITTGVPRLMSKIEEFSEVYWMDVRNGQIAASDKNGKVALINTEGETIWVHKEPGAMSGWMCYMDDTGKRELTKGDILWRSKSIAAVLFGQQDQQYVYAVNTSMAIKINKGTGALETNYSGGGPSMGVSKDSKMAITSQPLTIFSGTGELLHKFTTIVSMATWGDHEVYGIRNCIWKYDFSPEGIQKFKAGLLKTQSITAQKLNEVMPETTVAETTDTSQGVLCECVKEGRKLRIRVISPGYNNSWNVQFPRAIRKAGAKYVVENIVKESTFYRAWGDIKRVQS